MTTTQATAAFHRLTGSVKNRVLTYAQVRLPGLAGAVVRSITSGGSSKKSSAHKAAGHTPVAEGRYAPQGNGRTSGVLAAQAAAAPLPREVR